MTRAGADVKGAREIEDLFAGITERDKDMVIGYLSALNDKAIADNSREQQDKPLAVTT